MTSERIAKLVTAGESETLEFKSTTGTHREAAKTVCAMLNQQGGPILFGVTPEGGVIGQQVSERTIEEVSAELTRIDPPTYPAIERIPANEDREVIAISVGRGQAGPYVYFGRAYRRVDNTTVEMRADEYHRMLFERTHGERRWENQPADGWTGGRSRIWTPTRSVPPWGRRYAGAGSRTPELATPASCFAASGCCGTRFRGGWPPPQASVFPPGGSLDRNNGPHRNDLMGVMGSIDCSVGRPGQGTSGETSRSFGQALPSNSGPIEPVERYLTGRDRGTFSTTRSSCRRFRQLRT